MASNNPFRSSMKPPQTDDLPAAPPLLQKTYSTTSTIVGQRESEDQNSQKGGDMTRSTTVAGSAISARSSVDDPLKTEPFVITINDDPSQCSIQKPLAAECRPGVTKRCSMMNMEEDGKWRSMKDVNKTSSYNKRRRMIIKIVVAAVIVIGAVAIGLGISKAVRDANKN